MNLRVNDIVRLNVTSIANEGYGLARHDNFVIFIPYSAVGDEILAKITSIAKNHAFATISKIITSSLDRENPICKFYYSSSNIQNCGGCDFMHISYKKQLEYKEKFVLNAIEKIAKLSRDSSNFEWFGVYGDENHQFKYRNKSQLPLAYSKNMNNGKSFFGFFKPNSREIINIDNCIVQPDIANEILNQTIFLINEYRIKISDFKSMNGLRHICIRTNKKGEVLFTFVGSFKYHDGILKNIVDKLCKNKQIKGILYNENFKNTNVIFGNKFYVLHGKNELIEEINGIYYKISSESFFQVNSFVAEKLYSETLRFLDLKGNENILDLYCGIGVISILLSKHANNIFAVEIVEKAIENARENAVLNNVSNIDFILGNVSDKIFEFVEKVDVIVLNPPRKGAEQKVLEEIKKLSPKKIVYISCNPTTLARDLFILKTNYNLTKLKSFDMFPNTNNVETIALLEKI